MTRVYEDVIIAGFGGQGVMLIGNLLAASAMRAGFQVTYIPVYGPEMRGGTANCTVVISSEEIGSPIIRRPHSLIAMNAPSLDKFQSTVRDGGCVVANTSMVDEALLDTDRLRTVPVRANALAHEVASVRMAGMVALGAYLGLSGILPLQAAVDALPEVIPSHYAATIPDNSRALEAGFRLVSTKSPASASAA